MAPIDHSVAVAGPLAGSVLDLALVYAVVANTGQREGAGAPPVLLPSSLDGSAGGAQPLAGKTAGICWKVRACGGGGGRAAWLAQSGAALPLARASRPGNRRLPRALPPLAVV